LNYNWIIEPVLVVGDDLPRVKEHINEAEKKLARAVHASVKSLPVMDPEDGIESSYPRIDHLASNIVRSSAVSAAYEALF
jgi:hypothetical protein